MLQTLPEVLAMATPGTNDTFLEGCQDLILDDVTSHQGVAAYWEGMIDVYGVEWTVTYGSAILHTAVFLAGSAFYTGLQFFPPARKYKVQQVDVPLRVHLKVLPVALVNILVAWFPAMIGYHFLPFTCRMWHHTWESMPSWYMILARLWLALHVEDTIHYFHHRMLHHPVVYRHLHKWHHEMKTPIGLTAEYTHPAEVFIHSMVYVVTTGAACSHVADLLVFNVAKTYHGTVTHGGYDIWWINPLELLPGYIGGSYHDLHHEKAWNQNFAPTFSFWDRYFGTYATREMLALRLETSRRGHSGLAAQPRDDANMSAETTPPDENGTGHDGEGLGTPSALWDAIDMQMKLFEKSQIWQIIRNVLVISDQKVFWIRH